MNDAVTGADLSQEGSARPHSTAKRTALAVFAFLAFVLFLSLGTWQVKRLSWKQDLIARVDERVHAAPVAVPDRARWAQVTAASDEYRHVRVSGTFLYSLTTPVQASTVLGPGFWLLTPLRSEDGRIVLINRGFVPSLPESGQTLADAPAVVTGLLRMSEPKGSFIRKNEPAVNHWYSRDVQAIAATRGLADVAPYFVDADAATDPSAAQSGAGHGQPVGGLTVIAFPNNHLVYAITWYALALLLAGALWRIARKGAD